MKDLVINDGEIEKISSAAGYLEIIFKDWREDKWILSIDELIAFESIGAEGETLGSFIIEEQNEYKNKILKLMPEEENLKTNVFVFKSAWNDIPVLQAIGKSINAKPM
ncbi:hypothetical protein [Microbulbifer thermotolerans]|uniref:Uncharacterized protein n=1 Tax=Microbulbifer thermotolerans TaxID=252514 RepID=A0A143HNR3_MICTH|nr:hypothetical protein [Microbulbifer thermotolerans]AMX03141.1 hypothetical protein A3224_11655 [Microbulbifer thermotolerans]